MTETTETTRTIVTGDGPMECLEVAPDGDARGAVIVVQEAFGVNGHICDVTRRFARAGYHAVAPSLFHRAGGGTADYGDFGAVIPLFEGVTDDGILMDVDATLGLVDSAGFAPTRTGIVGFCFGGRATFLVAARRALGAAVGFYGGGIVNAGVLPFPALIGEVPSLQAPWLGLFGDEDSSIPVADVEALRAALADAPVAAEVVRYPGARHGFHCDQRPDDFHPEAAADAWARTLTWLDVHLP
ncbi:MAG TPA: dienelactone hydrolase family protein [Acidimicrobiia bacterium]|nr:dienelactone hydrolase family protein [Acidimicrobiia bacterium]